MEFSGSDVVRMWEVLVNSKTNSDLPISLYPVQADALAVLLSKRHLFFIINTGLSHQHVTCVI